MSSEYQDFTEKLLKKGSKAHKISACLGSRDAFNWVRKNKWKALKGVPVDKLTYSKVVSEIHKELVERMLEGHEIEFPYQMGGLSIIRIPTKVVSTEKGIKDNYRVDWKKTLDYRFHEDPDSHKLIKRIQPFIYSIKYNKGKARFRNRKFYLFRANRSLVRTVGKAAEMGSIRAVTM